VAIIKNVRSDRMGKKDIIKIDSPVDVNLDILGYIDPNITVNVIRNGERVEKKKLELPKKLVNLIHCKNPRCITTAESQLDAIFFLSDAETHTYRCAYCEAEESRKKF
jgi:aspartate carbamoyltransferase regulatory subunit